MTNLRERVWKPAVRRAGLRYRTMYQTRHTCATLMLAAGEDIGWAAEQLGHTSVEMVIGTTDTSRTSREGTAQPRAGCSPRKGFEVSIRARW